MREWLSGGAVSYTHLDVYKRQPIKRVSPLISGRQMSAHAGVTAIFLVATTKNIPEKSRYVSV